MAGTPSATDRRLAMALSRQALLDRLRATTQWNQRLVVEPVFEESADSCDISPSLDFHLGNRFTVLRSRHGVLHDPLSEEPRRDVVAHELFIPLGEEFSLEPGHVVLGTTLEWFRFPDDLIAYVIGRSIWGRRGLLIVTAQAVHPCSSGTITLELSNLGEVALRLKPGASIGQLLFHETNKVDRREGVHWARNSPFSCAIRPLLGKYRQTNTEQVLLKLS
jgi:dCTP deaminase